MDYDEYLLVFEWLDDYWHNSHYELSNPDNWFNEVGFKYDKTGRLCYHDCEAQVIGIYQIFDLPKVVERKCYSCVHYKSYPGFIYRSCELQSCFEQQNGFTKYKKK